MTCLCGAEIAAADLESLIQPVLDHMAATHPELGLGPVDVRNYLESEDRGAGAPTERLDHVGSVEVFPITPDRAEEILRFFDYDALPDNPAWASCYCVSYFPEGAESKPWQENREALRARIESGTVTGTVAYVDGKLAGWCNATARSEAPRRSTGDDSGVCSALCFVIAPPYRRHGLSGELLEVAIDHARDLGFEVMEGYPKSNLDNPEHAFTGPMEMYERAGFERVSVDPPVFRRKL